MTDVMRSDWSKVPTHRLSGCPSVSLNAISVYVHSPLSRTCVRQLLRNSLQLEREREVAPTAMSRLSPLQAVCLFEPTDSMSLSRSVMPLPEWRGKEGEIE